MSHLYTTKDCSSDSNSTRPSCPVGESRCEVIEQLLGLRQEVSELAEQVRTDTLTGLFNYHHLCASLEQEIERTHRTEQPTALIMVDLDHFKRINDRWGHEVGNQALIATAKTLVATTRRLDIACRYGGEEFAIILPSTDLMTAIQVAERIRRKIEVTPIDGNGEVISLTASLGVDVYYAGQTESLQQFIQRVDEQLYKAKGSGRNQVCYGSRNLASKSSVSSEERAILTSFFNNNDDD